MKRLFSSLIAAAAFCGFHASAAAEVSVQVQPDPMIAGEVANFQIVSTEGSVDIGAPPAVEGVNWVGGPQTSSSTQIINGNVSRHYSIALPFQAAKAGSYTIPSMKITVNGREVTTDPVTFKVEEGRAQTDGGAVIPLKDAALGELRLVQQAPSGKWYVGQEIPVLFEVTVLESALITNRVGMPSLKLENGLVLPPRQQDRNFPQPSFEPHSADNVIMNGRRFVRVRFPARFIPLAAGTVGGEARITVALRTANGGRRPASQFGDPMADAFFGGGESFVQQEITATLPPVAVEAVPAPAPQDGNYLGLCGKWELSLSTTPAAVPQGDPMTITLGIQGSGNLATLNPPKLDLPGFRLYEPEVKKDAAAATVTWVAIPLSRDAVLPKLAFCTFSPETGVYDSQTFTPSVKVLPSVAGATPGAVVDSGSGHAPAAGTTAERNASDILYIKAAPGPRILRPLWLNHLRPTVFLYSFGLVMLLFFTVAARRRERLANDPGSLRRQKARSEMRSLLGRLRNSPEDGRAALVREQLAPCLAAILGLPPGTTAGELAETLAAEHPELARQFREAETGHFRPGAGSAIDIPALLRGIKRLSLLAAFLAAAAVAGAAPAGTTPPVLPSPAAQPSADAWRDAATAYDQGAFGKAADAWRNRLSADAQEPHLFFNLGNCAYRLGNYGEAVACYETARRLAPRDSDILENLNFVRDHLGLPPVNRTGTPGELLVRLRDLLRPDEWLLLGGVWAAVGFCAAGWMRWRGAKPWTAAAATAAGLLLLAGILFAQTQSSYSRDTQAVVLENLPGAYRLPDTAADRADLKLKQGESITIVETRTGWCRVRAGGSEAWLRQNDVRTVW